MKRKRPAAQAAQETGGAASAGAGCTSVGFVGGTDLAEGATDSDVAAWANPLQITHNLTMLARHAVRRRAPGFVNYDVFNEDKYLAKIASTAARKKLQGLLSRGGGEDALATCVGGGHDGRCGDGGGGASGGDVGAANAGAATDGGGSGPRRALVLSAKSSAAQQPATVWRTLRGGPWVATLSRASRQPKKEADYRLFELRIALEPPDELELGGNLRVGDFVYQLPTAWTVSSARHDHPSPGHPHRWRTPSPSRTLRCLSLLITTLRTTPSNAAFFMSPSPHHPPQRHPPQRHPPQRHPLQCHPLQRHLSPTPPSQHRSATLSSPPPPSPQRRCHCETCR